MSSPRHFLAGHLATSFPRTRELTSPVIPAQAGIPPRFAASSGFPPVSLPSHQTVADLRHPVIAPALIGIGLAVLVTAAWWPNALVLTAMAIITLGASDSTISRFRDTPSFVPLLLLHGTTYGALYVLFLGATLNAASSATSVRAPSWLMLDFAASAFPVSLAMRRIATAVRQSITPTR